jgi:inosine/xanthosine triphosphate pyrophosphatase family protein
MKRLLLATRNAHKAREIQEILEAEFELRDLTAYPEISEIVESGKCKAEGNCGFKRIACLDNCR